MNFQRFFSTPRTIPCAALLLIAACAARPPAVGRNPLPGSAPASSPWGAVALEDPLAAQAAADALQHGANAIDAAITATLVMGVTASVSSGIGGGGFATVWDARSKTATVLDFRECAPQKFDPTAWEQSQLSTYELKRIAPPDTPKGLVVGVPGEVAGLLEMHRRWGSRPFAHDVEPAAHWAERGFGLSRHMVQGLTKFRPMIARSAFLEREFHDFLLPTASASGAKARNPALAATLRAIGAKGVTAFYEGPVARSIAEAVQREGGVLTEEDLRTYHVTERQPLRTHWEAYDIVTMPPPSAGGLMLLETLGSFSRQELASQNPMSTEAIHQLAETIRGAYVDRVRAVGDPNVAPVDLAPLLDPHRLAARRAIYRPDATQPMQAHVTEDHGTSHMVIADKAGNVVSLTSTVNLPFGSGIVAEDSGVLLNDQMTDFTPLPIVRSLGLSTVPGTARPGAKPPSSMTPTLVLEQGRPVFALGGSGGLRIATSVTQVALNLLARSQNVEQAVRAPRIYVNPKGELALETGSADPITKEDLERRGEHVREEESSFTAVQALSIHYSQAGVATFQAAADPRKGGVAMW